MRVLRLGVLAILAAQPAAAADITFSGTLSGVCTLALSTPGTLGLAADGALTSLAGLPAVLAILSVGTNQLTFDPPVWVATPGAYDPGVEKFEVAYSGLSGLGLADQAMTDTVTQRTISTLPLSLLTVHARIENSNGFEAGNYQTKVVVTCN